MEDHHAGLLLCRAQYAVQESELTVCLYASRAGIAFEYTLEIRQGKECARHETGQDLAFARMLFYKILSGGVSACHLDDVIGDELFATM